MEIRLQPSESSYVDTTIPKVAETPLEGSESSGENQIFGPFPTQKDEPVVMATNQPNKSPNKKGYVVHFAEPTADPIEKAFDSFFLFIDDVREASNTHREGGVGNGCMNVDTESLEADLEITKTLECVTDGLCRNPCVDSCSRIQPPVDLMLNVENASVSKEEEKEVANEEEKEEAKKEEKEEAKIEEKEEQREAYEEVEEVKEEPTKPEVAKATAFSLSKENSVKDMSEPVVDVKAEAPESQDEAAMPNYTPVETIVDRMKAMVSDEMFQKVMDACVLPTGEVNPNAEEHTLKRAVDSDPIIEAIDTLILFFDDLQENLEKQKNALVTKMSEISVADLTFNKSEVTATSQETMKTDNTKVATITKVKPPSLQMPPEEYAVAVESAASLLSACATEEEMKTYSKEELHRRALERIMAERPDSDDGFEEYKTEEMILQELMHRADQAIMEVRGESDDEEDTEKEQMSPKKCPNEDLIVLGHSATLTPIPEADEASAGTPASEKLEGALEESLPTVPLFPETCEEKREPGDQDSAHQDDENVDISDKEVTESEEATKEEGEAIKEKIEPKLEMELEGEESDIIVRTIDQMFLFYDDLQQEKSCSACCGSSVPSDLVNTSDEILESNNEVTEKGETEEVNGEEKAEVAQVAIEPRPDDLDKPETSQGQTMLEHALQVVQEASRIADELDTRSPDEMRIAKSSEQPHLDVDKPKDPADELMDQLIHAFDDARERAEFIERATSKLIGVKEIIGDQKKEQDNQIVDLVDVARNISSDPAEMTPQMSLDMEQEKQLPKVEFEIPDSFKDEQDPCIVWGGDDSELMASINADRKLSEMEHENIFRDVSKGLQESSGGTITRPDNQEIFSIYKAPAFTEGNSGSADLVGDRLENPAKAALKVLCEAESISCGNNGVSARRPHQLVGSTE